MSLENVVETDVLVIGGGMAGIFAAIKAKEQGVDVTLVEKGSVSRSGQTPYAHATAVFNPEWGHKLDRWMDQVNRIGEYINNREWTEIILKDSYDRYQDLVSWGVEFLKDDNGEFLKERRPGGASEALMMVPHNGSIGKWILTLRKQIVKSGVKVMERIIVTDLLKQDGRVVGAIGFPMERYDLYIFKAKVTIICTGAAGFKPWTGWPICQLTADGHAMAYRIGAEITGKEFVDFHGRPADTASRRPMMGMKMINAEGDEVANHGVCLGMDFEAHAGRAPLYRGETRMVGDSAPGMSVHTTEGISTHLQTVPIVGHVSPL